MYRSVYDLKAFYHTFAGIEVQRVLNARIRDLWPDLHGMQVLGCGYAVPYLDSFLAEAERVVAMMPATQGADFWPRDQKNLVFLSDEGLIPLASSSMDRILLIHHLEVCEDLQASLREAWRVLKPNGRLMVIVPNRTGFWARADWSPFGHGSPFTMSQICYYLRDNLFVQEKTQGGLYVFPLRNQSIMRSAGVFEHIGRKLISLGAGVLIVEASKQLYAGVDKSGSGSAVLAKTRQILAGKSVPVPNVRLKNK